MYSIYNERRVVFIMRPNFMEQIKNRINSAEPGSVFIPSDFFDITSAVKVNMCLNRLKESKQLNSVMRGVFAKPRYSNLLDINIPPKSDDIAMALARNYGWTIIPCGDTALNMLGLSTQIPAVWHYLSDGPYKTYKADGITYKFKHTDKKNEIIDISYKTALVIQALKALGKSNVTKTDIDILSKKLTTNEKQNLLSEGQRATAWVYECIKMICTEAQDE